jgi:hypothetical protein
MVRDLSGAERLLARGDFVGPIVPSGDGGVLAMRSERGSLGGSESDARRTIVRVGQDGAVTSLLTPSTRPLQTLGNGDGLTLFRHELPTGQSDGYGGAFALTSDGTLLFTEDFDFDRPGTGLRALVPAASLRPRIALTQGAFAAFARGSIRYIAPVPGTVHVIARRRGDGGVVEGLGQVTQAGEGELALRSVPSPGRYTLRLELATGSGAAATVAHLDTRRVLPRREARSALKSAYEDSDGDEGGSMGTTLGTCRHRAPRKIRCQLLYFDYGYEFDGPHVGQWSYVDEPFAWVTATLLNDGIHTDMRSLPHVRYEPRTCLDVATHRHPHVANSGLQVRVHVLCRARVRVAAHLRWRDRAGKHEVVLVRERAIPSPRTWQLTLGVPKRVLAALQARRHVRGEVIVRASLPTSSGTIPEEHGIPVFLHR